MKYLCLVYVDEPVLGSLDKREQEALDAESMDYDELLRSRDQLIVAEALQSVQTATSIRIGNGRISTTDGPFVETKEQVGGLVLIEARDLDEAIQIASKIPVARRCGGIEVRPIMELSRPATPKA